MNGCLTGQLAEGKVLNISTSGGRVLASRGGTPANVVTVNPKTLQFTTVQSSTADGGASGKNEHKGFST